MKTEIIKTQVNNQYLRAILAFAILSLISLNQSVQGDTYHWTFTMNETINTDFAFKSDQADTLILDVPAGVAVYEGNITGTGTVRKEGDGNLVISSVQTFEGKFIILEGQAQVEVFGEKRFDALKADIDIHGIFTLVFDGNFSSSNISLKGENAVFNISAAQEDVRVKTLTSDYEKAEVWLGANSLSVGRTDLEDEDMGVFAGSFSGSGRIFKTGAGTWTLTGNSSHTGGVEIAYGTLVFNKLENFGTGKVLPVLGTLKWAEGCNADVSSRLDLITSEEYFRFELADKNVTFQFPLEDDGSGHCTIIKSGAATLFLAAKNTFPGKLIIEEGFVNLRTSGSLTADIQVNDGCEINFNNPDNYTYEGVLSGLGKIKVVGSSTSAVLPKLILTKKQLHTGPIYIMSAAILALSEEGDISSSSRILLGGGNGNAKFDISDINGTNNG